MAAINAVDLELKRVSEGFDLGEFHSQTIVNLRNVDGKRQYSEVININSLEQLCRAIFVCFLFNLNEIDPHLRGNCLKFDCRHIQNEQIAKAMFAAIISTQLKQNVSLYGLLGVSLFRPSPTCKSTKSKQPKS